MSTESPSGLPFAAACTPIRGNRVCSDYTSQQHHRFKINEDQQFAWTACAVQLGHTPALGDCGTVRKFV